MSEIVNDLKISTLEITSTLGLNLTGDSARIKHEGPEGLTIEPHHNPAVPASVVTAQFGNTGTTDAFNVGSNLTNNHTDVRYDWRLGPNLTQVSVVVDLKDLFNSGTDHDFVGYIEGGAAEILLLPAGARILNISARVTETSNVTTDVYEMYADDASNNETAAAAAVATLILNNITANAAGVVPVFIAPAASYPVPTLAQNRLFLACQNTSAAGQRTKGKIVITMVLCEQA